MGDREGRTRSGMTSTELGQDYLEHYGVKGMKWGVRRTRQQLARARAAREAKKNSATERVKAERKALASKRRTLTDGDIEALTSRLKAEKQLKELVDADVAPGKAATKDIMSSSGKKVAKVVATGVGVYAVQQGLTKAFGESGGELAGKIKTPKP